MTTEIRRWLAEHGLAKYTESFIANDIGVDVVGQLTEDELKELGVSLGDRKRLIAALPASTPEDIPAPEAAARAPAAANEAERRHLTVMFCDLVGSVAIAGGMDAEDFRRVIAGYQSAATGAIERYGGYVARYMGDGLLVYFGYPQAHEDDAERAVRAGLDIVEAVTGLPPVPSGPLEVRIGIATGLVVAGDIVGEGASEERAVLGDTPNLASRLQGIAGPNRIVVSENTRRLTEGLFEGEVLRNLNLKGFSSPADAFQIERQSGVSSRFEAVAARGLVPLVGRDSELGLLLARWSQANAGEGQVVLLSGEAGVGKSRIVRALVDQAGVDRHGRALIAGSPYHTNSPFHPIVEELRRGFELQPRDKPARVVSKLEEGLVRLGLPPAELVPVLAALLSVSTEEAYPERALAPEVLRRRTLEALSRLVEARAVARPFLLIVEDAHWLDASTLDLLGLLIDAAEAATILVLVTFRPEFRPPWPGHVHLTAHNLNRLGRSDAARLIRQVDGKQELPLDLVDDIVAKTDGVPLFIEELTKAVLHSRLFRRTPSSNALGGKVPIDAVPASLQDSLMARLDQLAPVKQVAQFAAVIGRTFSRESLIAAAPFDEPTIETALRQLVASELVYRRGAGANSRYEFKHALVRDAAYESLLKSNRQEYHGRIARSLEQHLSGTVATEPEQIARHYTEAGLPEQAVPYWLRAGHRSLDRSALVEAIAQLDAGTELVKTLPASRERDRMELEFQLLLGSAYAQRGIKLEGSRVAHLRAKELADNVGDVEQRFRANLGVYLVYQHGGDLEAARQITDELIVVADEQDDSGLKLEACHAGWTSRFVAEELSTVVGLTQRGIGLYDVERHRDHRYQFGHDPGACAMTLNAVAKMFLGFADQANEMAGNALALATDLDHPGSKAMTLSFCTNVFRLRREPELVESWIDAQLELCEQHGFLGQIPFGHIIRGWALSAQDRGERGIELILKGIDNIRSFGIKTLSFPLCSLADAYHMTGQNERGLAVVDEAMKVVVEVGEHRWEPEILRLKGEMLLRVGGDPREAERAFERAMRIAREQEARWFELRAATSRARLWGEQGRRQEALDLLSPAYGWFTEGFDTRDLREAGSLIEAWR